jgi:hypothetical protein
MAAAGAGTDALRMQIEAELRAEARERHRRLWMIGGGVLLAISLGLNLLILAWPGAVGIASRADVRAVRAEAAASGAAQAESAREAREAALATERRSAQAVAALPVICATLTELGDWSFLSGEKPALTCPEAEPAP